MAESVGVWQRVQVNERHGRDAMNGPSVVFDDLRADDGFRSELKSVPTWNQDGMRAMG